MRVPSSADISFVFLSIYIHTLKHTMTSALNKGLTSIVDLAEASGIAISAIRHYQNIGLIQKPARAQYGGFRRYSQEDIDRLKFIQNALDIGFTLKEIAEILQHQRKGEGSALFALLNSRKSAIEKEILALNRNLEYLVNLCGHCAPGAATKATVPG